MNNSQELLNKSKELVQKIYENMSKVESFQALIETLENSTACFNHPEKGVIIMTDFLTDDQMEKLKINAINMINDNLSGAVNFLKIVTTRKPATVNAEFEAAIQEMVVNSSEKKETVVKEESVKAEPVKEETKNTGGKSCRMDITQVKKYIAEGKTNKEIADIYGYKSDSTVTYFLKKNGLEKRPDAHELKLDDGKIRACYVKGPFTLKQLAEEFGLDKKTMYEYCELHGLVKVQHDEFGGR